MKKSLISSLQNNYFVLLIILASTLYINGCEIKREALGADNEIVILSAIDDQENIGYVLRKIFNDTLYTPKPEPLYRLKFVNPEGFDELKRQTNLVIGSLGNNPFNPGTNLVKKLIGRDQFEQTIQGDKHFIFTKDQFAKNQLFTILSAMTKEELLESVEGKETWIKSKYIEQFTNRQKKFLFGKMRLKKLEKHYLSQYNWSIKIPWGWECLQERPDSNWVWLGREMPYQWFSIHWEEGLIITDSLKATEYAWNFPESYYGHIRYNIYKYNVEQNDFLNWIAWKVTGIWESLEEPKGGPFISYLFYDGVTDRTYHLNLLVFHPGSDKSIYLRQLDLIAHSFAVRD